MSDARRREPTKTRRFGGFGGPAIRLTQADDERARSQPINSLNFGIVGLTTSAVPYQLFDGAVLRAVNSPPDLEALQRTMVAQDLVPAVARWSDKVSLELSLDKAIEGRQLTAALGVNIAWAFVTCLRIKSLAEILVPVISDHSWSTINAAPSRSVVAQLNEDFPLALQIENGPEHASREDFDWAVDNMSRLVKMFDDQRLYIATEALTQHHQNNPPMALANLWTGIESLFDVGQELSFRLAVYIGSLLGATGTEKWEIYKDVKRLYNFRSRVVHGGGLNAPELESNVREVRALLSSLLKLFLALGFVPTADQIEMFLFEVDEQILMGAMPKAQD